MPTMFKELLTAVFAVVLAIAVLVVARAGFVLVAVCYAVAVAGIAWLAVDRLRSLRHECATLRAELASTKRHRDGYRTNLFDYACRSMDLADEVRRKHAEELSEVKQKAYGELESVRATLGAYEDESADDAARRVVQEHGSENARRAAERYVKLCEKYNDATPDTVVDHADAEESVALYAVEEREADNRELLELLGAREGETALDAARRAMLEVRAKRLFSFCKRSEGEGQ